MEAVIVDAVRTPVGRAHAEKGVYRDSHPVTLLQRCLEALIERTGIDPGDVEDVVTGCTAPLGEQSRNIGRNAWLAAGYPAEVPAVTLDRRCGPALAVESHRRAARADFANEIVPIETPQGTVTRDQGIRPDTNLETLAQLKTP